MTALERIRQWIATYPDFDILTNGFHVDYTDSIPSNGGIFPSGLVEVSRRKDIFGNTTVENQYNFGIYCAFEKSPGDDDGAAVNADWVMGFQEWVQEQSVTGQAPSFGDRPQTEKISAQNGTLYEPESSEGVAVYMVQLSVQFERKYEVENKWLM